MLMSFLSKFAGLAGSIAKYGALALPAIALAQKEIGGAAGDPLLQQNKRQLALSLVLAAAHAGEVVPNSQVQQIAGVIDFLASAAKATGVLGKAANPAGSVAVPAAETTPILDAAGGVEIPPA